MQNIPCCRSYNGAGFAVIFERTLLCHLKRYAYWREREGTGQWTKIYLWRPVVLSQLGSILCKAMYAN